MKYKQLDNKIIFRLERGEEVVESIIKLCRENNIILGTLSGIGATNKAVIGLFKVETKEYISKEYAGNYEITSLLGNISEQNGEVYLHIHANIADEKNICFGGHLSSAIISATFEGVIEKIEGSLSRKFDGEVGLNLLDL